MTGFVPFGNRADLLNVSGNFEFSSFISLQTFYVEMSAPGEASYLSWLERSLLINSYLPPEISSYLPRQQFSVPHPTNECETVKPNVFVFLSLYKSTVPSQRWQANAVRPPVRPENTSASIAALRSRLASQFDPSIAYGINAVIDRRTAQQPSPSSSGRRTPVSGKVAHHSGLKNLPGGDNSTAAAASSPSPPVPAGPKIKQRNQPTLPSKLCLKQGNT
ncbi:unnamed protein product [Dibothriocephalus latus]|uniref:Uncharacterized protein n=1 Tax=Dibothriocephalus latus TaxID=60516 RepID=A0A3P7LMZ9_DIBLA|nr:unnamed protein product [Dibothriocephalus latus]